MNQRKTTPQAWAWPLRILQRRFDAARPGSVLLFVVVLLVLLALIGTALLSTARLDRMAAMQHLAEVQSNQLPIVLASMTTKVEAAFGSIPTENLSTVTPANYVDGTVPAPGLLGLGYNNLPPGAIFAASCPELLPDAVYNTALTGTGYFTGGGSAPIPVWRNISLLQTGFAESPYNGSSTACFPQYDVFYNNTVDAPPQKPTTPAPTAGRIPSGAGAPYQYWYAPTSVVIPYPQTDTFTSNGTTYTVNPSLVGRTRVFPAFNRYYYSYNATTPGKSTWTLDPYNQANGPYLAADATGSGIADSALIPLGPSQIGEDNYYYAVRVIDNAASFNANAAYGRVGNIAVDTNVFGVLQNSNLNFFPSDIDAFGEFINTGSAASPASLEASAIYSLRGMGPAAANISFLNNSDKFWHQYGSRLGASRYFPVTDTGVLRYHGIMEYGTTPSSGLESATNGCGMPLDGPAPTGVPMDSLYYYSINHVDVVGDAFNYLPANQVTYWFDWNYNWENYAMPNASFPSSSNSGLSSAGLSKVSPFSTSTNARLEPFRTSRALMVSANPVVGKIPPPATRPATSGGGAVAMNVPNCVQGAPAAAGTNYGAYPQSVAPYTMCVNSNPVAVSLNTPSDANTTDTNTNGVTSQFPDLWRQFWMAMSGPADPNTALNTGAPVPYGTATNGGGEGPLATGSGLEWFHVAGDPVNSPDTGTFRPTFRDPSNASVPVGSGPAQNLNTNLNTVIFDKWNQLLLRAAIAAVNTEQFRYVAYNSGGRLTDIASNAPPGQTPSQYYGMDMSTLARKITLRGYNTLKNNYNSYDVVVNATGAQPFITEVYALTDTTTSTYWANSHKAGYVGIELFNPYPFPLPLDGYALAVTSSATPGANGGRSATSAANAYPLNCTEITGDTALAGQSVPAYGTLLLENCSSTGTDPRAATMRPPDVVAANPTSYLYVKGLDAVFKDTTAGNNGGELVLLRPHQGPQVKVGTSVTAAVRSNAAVDLSYNETSRITDMVPCDSFDFTGMSLDYANGTGAGGTTGCYAMAIHYLRDNTKTGWKWVYPGPYNPSNNTLKGSSQNPSNLSPTVSLKAGQTIINGFPRQYYTDYVVYNPNQGTINDPTNTFTSSLPSKLLPTQPPAAAWNAAGTPASQKVMFGQTHPSPASANFNNNNFPPVQLNNINFGGPNKCTTSGNYALSFPFGGFARLGDVLQVPFIGSYTVYVSASENNAPWPAGSLIEVNPVTMDCAFSDDGDATDDTVEFLGHFIPVDGTGIRKTANPSYDDYNPNGDYWGSGAPNPGPQPTRYPAATGNWSGLDPTYGPSSGTTSYPYWRYRWVMHVMDYFSTVSNPADDYQPNCDFGFEPNFGSSYACGPKNGITVAAAVPVQNGLTGPANNHNEDYIGSEGRLNINTANWKALSAIEMIPRGSDTTGALNLKLAKCIVRYRDFDDGLPHHDVYGNAIKVGHGPFRSLMELNRVFDPTPNSYNAATQTYTYTNTFQNGLGLVFNQLFLSAANNNGLFWKAAWCPAAEFGNLQNYTTSNVEGDFQAQMMMVNRISNLVTLRTDSATAYILVQQWHNIGTPYPELVHQRRSAFYMDRSTVPPGSVGNANLTISGMQSN